MAPSRAGTRDLLVHRDEDWPRYDEHGKNGEQNFVRARRIIASSPALSIPNLNWAYNDTTCGLESIQTMTGTVVGRTWNMTQHDTWLCQNQAIHVDRMLVVQLTQ